MIRKLVNGQVVDLTSGDKSEIEAGAIEYSLQKQAKDRQSALAEQWPDAFAMLDDIFSRGLNAVKEDREAIKAAYPIEEKPIQIDLKTLTRKE